MSPEPKLALWYNKVEDENLKSFNTIKKTIQHHYKPILNYFNNRNTNASAESFNPKIKAFRAQFRGVRDVTFFLYIDSLKFMLNLCSSPIIMLDPNKNKPHRFLKPVRFKFYCSK
ncbi:transposase [Tenacibaculum finnmarkense]|uniref:transposase n=1 Tax=Tenacibaculum finnmarkense TaxID=2781243 RepID=UPI0021111194|nr:transposase [Tenacibaculum finnmarkense]